MEVICEGPCAVASIVWRKPSGSWTQTVVCKLTFMLRHGEAELLSSVEPIREVEVPWSDAPAGHLYAPADLAPLKPQVDVLVVGRGYPPRDTTLAGGMTSPLDPSPFAARLNVAGIDKIVALTKDSPLVVELAPLSAGSALRQAALGALAGRWPGEGWNLEPIPEAISPAFFNVAPEDQRVAEIRDDQEIRLTALHPEHPLLVTRLPGARPVVRVKRPAQVAESVKMKADTLWIHTDRGLCTLTFRGRVGLDSPEEEGCVSVRVTGAGSVLQEHSTNAQDSANATQVDTAPLPVIGDMAAIQTPPPFPIQTEAAHYPRTEPPPFVALKSDERTVTLVDPIGLPSAPTPWAPSLGPSTDALRRVPPPPLIQSPARSIALEGALAASNAAAGVHEPRPDLSPQPAKPTPKAEPKPAPRRERIELLWFDPAALPRIRRNPSWKKIIADLKPRPSDDDFDGGLPADQMKAAKDKRDILGVLARGEALDLDGIKKAIDMAEADDGSFVPPYVLTSGILELPFDEVETLKAMRVVVSPFLRSDKKLQETVDHIDEVMKTQGIERAKNVALGMITLLERAFDTGNRGLATGYLRAEAEPLLLEGRRYAKRDGQIRGLLTIPGAEKAVVACLPEEMGESLPSMKRFEARVIALAREERDVGVGLWTVATGRQRGNK